ncbi:MAG: class I lanthipeptide [Hyphomicrobiales bacterium]
MKKLNFKKATIAKLSNRQKGHIIGGATIHCDSNFEYTCPGDCLEVTVLYDCKPNDTHEKCLP